MMLKLLFHAIYLFLTSEEAARISVKKYNMHTMISDHVTVMIDS